MNATEIAAWIAGRDAAGKAAERICEDIMSRTETPLKRAVEDAHTSEEDHQEGKWHGANDCSLGIAAALAALAPPAAGQDEKASKQQEGAARVKEPQMARCLRCNGYGQLRVSEPECNDGEIYRPCDRCRGLGRHPPPPDALTGTTDEVQAAILAERAACALLCEGWPCQAAGDDYQSSGNGRFWAPGSHYDQGRLDASFEILHQPRATSLRLLITA